MDKPWQYLLTFFVILTLNFALPRMMPGDPFLYISGEENDMTVQYSQDQLEYYREYYGLDQPILTQYFYYLREIASGDLGFSYSHRENVSTLILNRLPWTMLLVTSSMILSLVAGTLLGSYSAWRRNKWNDSMLYPLVMVISEIPAFLIGLALLVVFASTLGWFPLSGAKTHFAIYQNVWESWWDIGSHAVLPVATLTIARTGSIYLMVRNSLSTVLTKDYMRTAKAKGLKEYRIRYLHALRNALVPLITRIALQLGGLVGGAVLVENVFAYPGLGTLMTTAVAQRDYPLLQGIFLVTGTSVILGNYFAERLYHKLDPRIGQEGKKR